MQGKWLVRIEDLDPPREMPGAADLILKTLERYQLHWDESVVYQSQRHHLYQGQIDKWLTENKAYYCQCSRKDIKAEGGFYRGQCRDKQLTDGAIRLKMAHPTLSFNDLKHGEITIPQALAEEDFIIKRRDGLFAYNLAVVLDDIDQGITQVVRGADLIEPTGRQISLYHLLGYKSITYLHLPLAMDINGNKLSKQNHAEAIDMTAPEQTLIAAMRFLGFTPDPHICAARIEDILAWGCQNWHLSQLPNTLKITA